MIHILTVDQYNDETIKAVVECDVDVDELWTKYKEAFDAKTPMAPSINFNGSSEPYYIWREGVEYRKKVILRQLGGNPSDSYPLFRAFIIVLVRDHGAKILEYTKVDTLE